MSLTISKTRFKLWSKHNVLYAAFYGAWNHSVATRYATELKKHIDEFNGEPWAHIVYMNEWQLGTPEIEPIIKELEIWCITHNVQMTAIVFPSDALKTFQLKKMVRGQDNRMYQLFEDAKDAHAWINLNGFTIIDEQ